MKKLDLQKIKGRFSGRVAQRWMEKYCEEEKGVKSPGREKGGRRKVDYEKRKAEELSLYALRSVMLERFFESHPGEEKRNEQTKELQRK
jgi:hypothetical protein